MSRSFFLEVLEKGVSRVIPTIRELLDISPQEMMTMGDGKRPVMIELGLGVAMGNTTDQVKGSCPICQRDVEESGVTHAIP